MRTESRPCDQLRHGGAALYAENDFHLVMKEDRTMPLADRLVSILCVLLIVMTGSVASAENYQRIISLGGDLTEIIYRLGEEDRLVATDTTSVFPPAALQTPKVGYVRQLSAEGVLSMEPDLILVSGPAGPETAVEQLIASGVRIVQIPEVYSIEAIREKVRIVSSVLGAEERGEAVIAEIDADWAEAQDIIAATPIDPRVLFFLAVGDGTPRASGTGTAADAVIELIGGENVFSDRQGVKAFSFEAAVLADPDIILVMEHHTGPGGLAQVAQNPALSVTRAAQNGHLLTVDGASVMQFGPRTPEALAALAQDINAIIGAAGTPTQ